MSDRIFLDTNILVYALLDEGNKQQIAFALLQSSCVISTQVLNEFVQVARKKARLEWEEISDLSNAIQTLVEVIPLTQEIHNTGLAIAARYGYGFYDSLIIAAAITTQCNLLVSEDMQNTQTIQRLTIHNPFNP